MVSPLVRQANERNDLSSLMTSVKINAWLFQTCKISENNFSPLYGTI